MKECDREVGYRKKNIKRINRLGYTEVILKGDGEPALQ